MLGQRAGTAVSCRSVAGACSSGSNPCAAFGSTIYWLRIQQSWLHLYLLTLLSFTLQHNTTTLLAGAVRGAWGAPQETEGVSGAEPAHRLHAPGGVQGAARGALHSINARWVVMRSISVWYGAWCCGLLCGASCTCPRQCSGRAAQPRCQVGGAGLRLTSIRCFEIGCLKQLQQHTAHCNASKPFPFTFILHTPQTMHFVLLNFLQQPL